MPEPSGTDQPFAYRVEIRDGYVFVWQGGMVENEAQLRVMQEEIAGALSRAGTRVAMFDNRDTEKPDEWLRAMMWTWLLEHLSRAALLQSVERNKRRAERRGQENRISLRAFGDEDEAEAWLLGGVSTKH
jgi:hypothetical protein